MDTPKKVNWKTLAITRVAKQLSTFVSKINVFVIIMPVSK